MANQENQPRKHDEPKDQPKPDDDLTKVSSPPIQDLSDEQLDEVSGGALSAYVYPSFLKQGQFKGPGK